MTVTTWTVMNLLVAVATAVLAVAGLVVLTRLAFSRAASGEDRSRSERLGVLLGVLAFNVLITRAISWGTTLMMLEDLAPVVSGAMCGFGVLEGSPLLSRFLVGVKLATALGLFSAWLLRRAQRDAGGDGSSLRRPLAVATGLALLLAASDSGLDVAFTTAPRDTIEVSCCSTVLDVQDRLSVRLPEAVLGTGAGTKLLAVFLALAVTCAVGGGILGRSGDGGLSGRRRLAGSILALVGISLFPLGVLASMESLSPVVLHLPHHHCPVEVWTQPPDGGLMLGLLVLASCLPAAAGVVSVWAGGSPAVARAVRAGMTWGSVATWGLVVMICSHLAVAWIVP